MTIIRRGDPSLLAGVDTSPEVPTFPVAGGAGASPMRPDFDWAELLQRITEGFGMGRAIREGDSSGIMAVMNQLVDRRRLKIAEEAQRLREEREGRLAGDATRRAEAQEARAAAQEKRSEAADKARQLDDQRLFTQDITKRAEGYNPESAAAFEELINQAEQRAAQLGIPPGTASALMMATGTQEYNRPDEQVPLVTLEPGKPAPAKVAKGAIVRNAPQPRQPREPDKFTTTDEEGNIYRVVGGVKTLVGKRPKTSGNDLSPEELKLLEGFGGVKPPPTGARPPGHENTPYKVGDVVTVRGQKVRVTKLLPNGKYEGEVVP